MEFIELPIIPNKKIYFASDFHLGAPDRKSSTERERKIIAWLSAIKSGCQSLFLLGDIFDFWFEYKNVIPKGYIRFLAKIAEFVDNGIAVYFFTGNHDMWMFNYLEDEIGVKIIRDSVKLTYNNKKFYLHHGDGLGKYDIKYSIIKKFFRSKPCQKLFACLHPQIGFWIATTWSEKSRKANQKYDEVFLGEEEWLIKFIKCNEKKEHFDYYIFGHRHLNLFLDIDEHTKYINLGQWFSKPYFLEVWENQTNLISVDEFLYLSTIHV
jgi:UDP-2,3-diacylglucosamine hydrolase